MAINEVVQLVSRGGVVVLNVTAMAASIGSATNVVDGLSQSINKQNA
jgi:hypothetical protein